MTNIEEQFRDTFLKVLYSYLVGCVLFCVTTIVMFFYPTTIVVTANILFALLLCIMYFWIKQKQYIFANIGGKEMYRLNHQKQWQDKLKGKK